MSISEFNAKDIEDAYRQGLKEAQRRKKGAENHDTSCGQGSQGKGVLKTKRRQMDAPKHK